MLTNRARKWALPWMLIVFFALACTPEPPAPPHEVGESVEHGSLSMTIEGFYVGSPDFVDDKNHSAKATDKNTKVAIIRLAVTNNGEEATTFYPQHLASAGRMIQLSTLPDPETGERIPIEAITLPSNIFTTTQIQGDIKVQPGETIIDDYLFKVPVVDAEKLLVLIPGVTIGNAAQVYRYSVANAPEEIVSNDVVAKGKPFAIDGVSVTLKGTSEAYTELVNTNSDAQKKLKFPFAYTTEIVLKLDVTITNKSKQDITYDPSHRSNDASGVELINTKTGRSLKRVKLPAKALAKGQTKDPVTIKPGKSFNDSFLFQRPTTSGNFMFLLSGHVLNVKGLYRFSFSHKRSEPVKPDFEPYKKAAEEAAKP